MVSCFYPKADKRGTDETRVESGVGVAGKVQKFSAILNVSADRKGHSGRKEQIYHVGTEFGSTQPSFRRSKSTTEESLFRPFSSLTDHINSLSQRFPSSTKRNLSSRASEVTEVATDDWAAGKDARGRKKFHGGSFRKLVSRWSVDDVTTDPAESAAPDDKQQDTPVSAPSSESSGYQSGEADQKNLALLLSPAHMDDRPEIAESISQEQQQPGAPKSPHLNLLVPTNGIYIPIDVSDNLTHPQVAKSLDYLVNPPFEAEINSSMQTYSVLQDTSGQHNHSDAPVITTEEKATDQEDGTIPSEPKSDWERILERTIAHMTDSTILTHEIEEAEEEVETVHKHDGDKVVDPALRNSQPVADWQNMSRHPGVQQNSRSITGKEEAVEEEEVNEGKADKRDAQYATLSQRVAVWLGRSRITGRRKNSAPEKPEKADKHEELVEPAPISQPLPVQLRTKPIPIDSTTAQRTENSEKTTAYNDAEKAFGTPEMSVPNCPPAFAFETKLADVNHDSGVHATAPGKIDYSDHEIAETRRVPEAVTRVSSVSDNEAVARLWEQLDMVDGEEKQPGARNPQVAEEKLVASGKKLKGFAAAAATPTRARRRRVRFSTCGGSNDASIVDISATLLGKLSATKHHQVRYLQDELKKTRAQVAQLEDNVQAQRDLKMAFKMQAVRLGSALKNLRQFALENGLDPRGLDGSFSNSTFKAQLESSDDKTKEINSFPALVALKTQATEFGWLCDPKDVELREQIGSGSTADIFKGVWQTLDVAVKCLRPDIFAENPDVIGGFCQEVELLSRHRHPYVLRMFAACLSPPDHAWIITEYLPSGTMTEWLHSTKTRERERIVPLPPLSERLRIATEISVAMHYLHELSPKVLHRDLKPSNILLDENNHVRIADFNCARYFTAKDAAMTGETGTYVYMAPEVMAHESYDEKCDIYSFAVILCELVTGTPPYVDTGYSPAEIACKVAQGTLRPTLPNYLPAVLADLIKDAWEQKPRMRPSFSAIIATLEVITGDFLNNLEPSVHIQKEKRLDD